MQQHSVSSVVQHLRHLLVAIVVSYRVVYSRRLHVPSYRVVYSRRLLLRRLLLRRLLSRRLLSRRLFTSSPIASSRPLHLLSSSSLLYPRVPASSSVSYMRRTRRYLGKPGDTRTATHPPFEFESDYSAKSKSGQPLFLRGLSSAKDGPGAW